MKRKSSRYRRMGFLAPFVRTISRHQPDLSRLPSVNGQREYSKWIPVSDIGDWLRHASTGSGQRKIFAIVTPSTPADVGSKPIRRVLIFDNHPDSLRLVFKRRLNSDVDLAMTPPTGRSHVILGLVLILALALAMFWPLIVN